MSEAVDEQTRSKLSALERLELLRDAPVDWNDPAFAKKWVDEGYKEGLEEARAERRAKGIEKALGVIQEVHREAEARFGPETAGQLMGHLARKSDLVLLMEILAQIREGTPYDTLLTRIDNGS